METSILSADLSHAQSADLSHLYDGRNTSSEDGASNLDAPCGEDVNLGGNREATQADGRTCNAVSNQQVKHNMTYGT